MSLSMSTFSINERVYELFEEVAEVSCAIAFLLRDTDGMVAPLWNRAATILGAGAEGVAVGLPTTVVAGATLN